MTKAHLIKVYREAARIVAQDEENHSCLAVKHAVPNVDMKIPYLLVREVQIYQDVIGYRNLDSVCVFPDVQNLRVLLLLLMAEYIRTDWKAEPSHVESRT